ncbi:MAG TPA: DNA-3-methyladenine glycosylase I [Armatimonadota bacterium]|nr:DNA-3-methyladenine glycosylase I [Armatimonadota bacterium]
MEKTRCAWSGDDPLMISYHDEVWGVPLHDDIGLCEFLLLEGAQAGLSWSTILRKRENYRTAFSGFDPSEIARYDDAKVASLLQDAGIVRNRLKVRSAITNAQAILTVQSEFGSFDRYIWEFVGGETIQNAWRALSDLPTTTLEAETMSRDLLKRGFKFVGPTICYAFMQAVGMVNDHTGDCYRWAELGGGRTP